MKKIILSLMLLLVLLLSLRLYELTNTNDYSINIRNTPYASGELISEINKGEKVIVTKTYNKWVEILYQGKKLYTYREFLNCTGFIIYPFKIMIPCNLQYKWTPDILFTDSIKLKNYSIEKYKIQILLVILIMFVFIIKPKKSNKSNNRILYPELNKSTSKDQVYRVKYRPRPLHFSSSLGASTKPINTTTQCSQNYEDLTDLSKKKGDKFEQYIVKKINRFYYSFEEWASDKITDTGIWAASNQKPDLKFRDKKTKKDFYLECKYRSSDNIQMDNSQLNRYKKFGAENSVNVFIVIGTEGRPDKPRNLYLIPSYVIKDSESINLIKEKYRKHNINSNLYFDPIKRTLS